LAREGSPITHHNPVPEDVSTVDLDAGRHAGDPAPIEFILTEEIGTDGYDPAGSHPRPAR